MKTVIRFLCLVSHAEPTLHGLLLGAIGLLTRIHCTPENELLAWQFYRTDLNDRLPGVWAKLTPFVDNRETLRIKCVGVFDTVGALGVPTRALWRFNRAFNEFHNVELSSITDVNLHAIAIDEHRVPFEATVWRKPKFKQFATCTEQVWVLGAHADVGGCYIDEEKRDSNSIALDDITLDWMLQRLKSHFSDFPFEQDAWKVIDKSWSVAQQHDPHSERMYRSTPLSLRSIANYAVENLCSYECNMGRCRHADTIGEMVHVSALERLGKTVQTDEQAHRYEPKNLTQILPVIKATYSDGANPLTRPDIRVVGWTGEIFKPENPSDRTIVQQTIAEALERLQ